MGSSDQWGEQKRHVPSGTDPPELSPWPRDIWEGGCSTSPSLIRAAPVILPVSATGRKAHYVTVVMKAPAGYVGHEYARRNLCSFQPWTSGAICYCSRTKTILTAVDWSIRSSGHTRSKLRMAASGWAEERLYLGAGPLHVASVALVRSLAHVSALALASAAPGASQGLGP